MSDHTLMIDAPECGSDDLFVPAEALDRACGDLELLAELDVLFRENRDRLLLDLSAAVRNQDARSVADAAHALKGSIGTFSTRRPFRLAREMEYCAKEHRLENAPQLLDSLQAALAELETAVTLFLSSQH